MKASTASLSDVPSNRQKRKAEQDFKISYEKTRPRLSKEFRNVGNNEDRKSRLIKNDEYFCLKETFGPQSFDSQTFYKVVPDYISEDLYDKLMSALDDVSIDPITPNGYRSDYWIANRADDAGRKSFSTYFGTNMSKNNSLCDYVSGPGLRNYKIYCEIKMVGNQNNIYSSADLQHDELTRLSLDMNAGRNYEKTSLRIIMVYLFVRHYHADSRNKAYIRKWLMWRKI
jgi:hypothetical protein